MPRVNIYLPNDVYELAERWRDEANLSEVCARAIRDEFDAREMHRAPPAILRALRVPSPLETALTEKFDLAEVLTCDAPDGDVGTREAIGDLAAKYLDENICDDSNIAIAGGRQIWCVVRRLSPRRVRTSITALGLHHADPRLLHVHPNSLATFLWLLYGPRSQAHLIGVGPANGSWGNLPQKPRPSYFVLSSCSELSNSSAFSELLGTRESQALDEGGAVGDFAYSFIDDAGRPVEIETTAPSFLLGYHKLKELSQRPDARIILAAGGAQKQRIIHRVLEAGLANVLVTDIQTGGHLLERH